MSHLYPHFKSRTPQLAEVIRERCQAIAIQYTARPFPENWYATTIGVLQAACYYGLEHRHSITMYLFGKTSSKDLTMGERWALYAWVFPHHKNDKPGDDHCPAWCNNPADKWHTHPALPQEIKNILDARLLEQGQMKLSEIGGWKDPAELKQREW